MVIDYVLKNLFITKEMMTLFNEEENVKFYNEL